MKKVYKDFFFYRDIVIVVSILILLMIGNFYFVNQWQSVLYLALGAVSFILLEYVNHRFIFHLKPPQNKLGILFLKRIHYDHHSDPDNLKLLFLPVWYSLPGLIFLTAIMYALTKNAGHTIMYGEGLLSLLLVYEWKHYVAHRPITPITRFGKWLKKTHILHHFKNENYWYGVSNPWLDYLFGTMKDEKEVEKSKTAKSLEKRM